MRDNSVYCLACGSSTKFVTRRRSRDYDQSTLYGIYCCDNCASFTADCPYTPELYDEQYYLIAEDPRTHDPQMHHYANIVNKLSRKNGPAPAILDVGCGSGKFLHSYSRIALKAHLSGLEIDPVAVRKIRRDSPAFNIYAGYEELGNTSFDVVCAWNVIEHVPDPRMFLGRLVKHTKTGGLIAISTPNHTQINRWLQGMRKWEAIDPPHHLCILSRRALLQIFGQCGVRPIDLSTFSWHFGGYYNPAQWWKPKYILPTVLGKLRLGGNLLLIGRKVSSCPLMSR